MRGSFISCLATLTFQVLKLSKWSLKSNFISITMFEKIFRVLPNGPIRSQSFVLNIFPRKFGPISAPCIVYILAFTEILAMILIIKAVDIFGYFQPLWWSNLERNLPKFTSRRSKALKYCDHRHDFMKEVHSFAFCMKSQQFVRALSSLLWDKY